MRLTFCLTICLVQVVLNAAADKSTYTIIAPGRIYANETYTVAVSVHHISRPCKINISISGPSYDAAQQVEVRQYKMKTVKFDVPHLAGGEYSLSAEGVGCLDNFINTTEIIYDPIRFDMIIQTDKGLYRTGDEVHFRVLFMDKDLRPVEPPRDGEIWFSDAENNVVERIHDIKTVMGVYTGKFKIPYTSAPGEWTLGVANVDYDITAVFEVVSKYIVKVETAQEAVAVKSDDLQLFITANHVCGEPVNGKVDIEISLDIGYLPKPPPILRKSVHMVNGTAEALFNVRDAYANYTHDYRIEMEIVANVEEEGTGADVSHTIRRYIYPFSYTLSCSRETDDSKDDSCFSFEPERENTMIIQMMHMNGSIVEDTTSTVNFIFKEVLRKDYRYTGPVHNNTPPVSRNHTFTVMGRLNATGFINVKALLHDLPEYEGYHHYYLLKYKYLDEERSILYTYPKRHPTKYFTLSDQMPSDENLYVKKPYPLTINSSEPLRYLNYIIIGHRNIMTRGSFKLSHKTKVHHFIITPQPRWGRKFRVYVYYVDDNGEYHYDEKIYRVHVSPNPVMIEQSAFLKSGENATITIQTNPKSFVGLMAVDQRMLLMKRNNDFTASVLDDVLNNFATFTPSQGGYSRYPGAIAGCVTLTNADYFYSWESIPKKPKAGGFGEEIVPRKSTQTVAMPSIADKSMCETLSFENLESSAKGEIVFSAKVPDIRTTWVFTAFSVNPVNGFSIAGQATEITVFK